ncbi:MAG TPA: TonB-dependent receptor, partial [Opitutus sp.]|nr:TonB-dependent receptor [Opitutus sp.]
TLVRAHLLLWPVMNHFRLFPIILFALVPARAADEDAPPSDSFITLERFEVSSDRTKSLTVPSAEAARIRISLTPGGVETIDANRYLRGRAATVADTFALSPGIIAQSRFGSDEARLSIRGSGLQRTFHGRGLRILQDGVPLNLADGSFDMQAFEPLSAAYINVWRGGNALAYGASTLGGAIDYVSRTGRDGPTFLSRLEAGSDDYRRASLSAGGARGDLDAYGSFTHQSQRGSRAHSAQSNQRLFANAGARLTAHAETRFYVTAVQSDSELPGNLTKAQVRTDATQAAAANVALNQKRDFDLLRAASKTTVRTGTTVWDLAAAWTYKDLDHPIFQVIDQLSNDLLLGITGLHTSGFGGYENRLRGGILYQRGTIRAANFTNAAGRRGPLVTAASQTATNFEAFLENQFAIGRQLTLVLGASASTNQRENQPTFGAGSHYDLGYNRVMPKLGLRWDRRDVQVYVNFSGSYEPPSFSETLTANTARDAQIAATWEFGTRGTHGPVRWDATVYHAALRNELLALDHDNNPSTPAATVNAESTTHVGFEFATEIDLLGRPWNSGPPAERLVLRAAWTVGQFRFDDDLRYGRNTLAGLPPHLIRAELAWETATGWYAGPTVEWVPEKTFIDFRNTFAADPYAMAGFRVGRRLASGLSWFAEIRNGFDRTYVATTGVIENANGVDQPQFLPGDPRSVFVGIEFRW